MYTNNVFEAEKTKIEEMDFRVWQMERARSQHDVEEKTHLLFKNRRREIIKN